MTYRVHVWLAALFIAWAEPGVSTGDGRPSAREMELAESQVRLDVRSVTRALHPFARPDEEKHLDAFAVARGRAARALDALPRMRPGVVDEILYQVDELIAAGEWLDEDLTEIG